MKIFIFTLLFFAFLFLLPFLTIIILFAIPFIFIYYFTQLFKPQQISEEKPKEFKSFFDFVVKHKKNGI